MLSYLGLLYVFKLLNSANFSNWDKKEIMMVPGVNQKINYNHFHKWKCLSTHIYKYARILGFQINKNGIKMTLNVFGFVVGAKVNHFGLLLATWNNTGEFHWYIDNTVYHPCMILLDDIKYNFPGPHTYCFIYMCSTFKI